MQCEFNHEGETYSYTRCDFCERYADYQYHNGCFICEKDICSDHFNRVYIQGQYIDRNLSCWEDICPDCNERNPHLQIEIANIISKYEPEETRIRNIMQEEIRGVFRKCFKLPRES